MFRRHQLTIVIYIHFLTNRLNDNLILSKQFDSIDVFNVCVCLCVVCSLFDQRTIWLSGRNGRVWWWYSKTCIQTNKYVTFVGKRSFNSVDGQHITDISVHVTHLKMLRKREIVRKNLNLQLAPWVPSCQHDDVWTSSLKGTLSSWFTDIFPIFLLKNWFLVYRILLSPPICFEISFSAQYSFNV